MDMIAQNYIELRNNRRGEPRAFIAGTRLRVQDVVSDYEQHGMTTEQIAAEYPGITLAQIHAALVYFFENQSEIHQALQSDRKFVSQLESSQNPKTNSDAGNDSISSR